MASNSIFDSFATYSSAFLRGEYRLGSFVARAAGNVVGFCIYFILFFFNFFFCKEANRQWVLVRLRWHLAPRRGFLLALRCSGSGVGLGVCCRLFWLCYLRCGAGKVRAVPGLI